MKYFTLIACLILVFSCQNKPKNDNIDLDEDFLLHNLKVLSHDSLQGRFFGTEGNKKAQEFIAKQFDSLGIQPAFPSGSIQEYNHTFSGKERQGIYPVAGVSEDQDIPDTTVTGGNVVTMIKGTTEKTIVITGHLDHLGIRDGKIFNGADDNASGSAALLSIANYFKERSPQHTLIFAAVDAEEIGSLGCIYLLDNFPVDVQNIALNINMDMIGHNDSSELYASGLYHNPDLKPALDSLKSGKIKLLYGHDDPDNEDLDDWTFSSDHRVFHQRQIPFIYFGVEDHEDYHQETDQFRNINKEFYVEAVKLIIRAIEEYDSSLNKKLS